jgi:D-xylose transport system substrate-binding protein
MRSWVKLALWAALPQAFAAVQAPFVHASRRAPKVGFILGTMQEERYARDRKAFEEHVRKLGGTVLFASCNNSEQTQAAEVDRLLGEGADVLVIQPVNGDTATSFVKHARDRGVPIVDYDRLIRNAPVDAYVTEDSLRVGQLQAEAAVSRTGGKGNYVILMGQAGHSVAEGRTEGVLSVLKKYPEIRIVSKRNHPGWSPNLAMQTVETVLSQYNGQIHAILANNSGMAHAAVQAISERGVTGKIFVAGADADLAAIRDVAAGREQLEVYISIQDMARRAAEVAIALARKEQVKHDALVDNGFSKIPTIHTPVFPVDRAGVEAQIIKTGFHTREAVYGP